MANQIMQYGKTEMAQGPASRGVGTEMMASREAQEVQVAMIVAKRFPRDEIDAINRIITACQRKGLAEQAMYEYERGGTPITGPSIHLAQALAQNWGNLDTGWIKLEDKDGVSTLMAYCWDLETNTRQTKIFTVPHIRHTRKGDYALTDARDIYEMEANQASRRVRSCILSVIPGDVVDTAMSTCQKTLAGASEVPLKDRIRKMVKAFQDNFGVTKEMVESFIGFRTEAFTEQSIIRLRKVYTAIKDGAAPREQFFDLSIAGIKKDAKKTGSSKGKDASSSAKKKESSNTPSDALSNAAPPNMKNMQIDEATGEVKLSDL